MTEHIDTDTPKKGTGFLLAGASTALYGGITKLFAGYICPLCLLMTPMLLLIGLYRRWFGR